MRTRLALAVLLSFVSAETARAQAQDPTVGPDALYAASVEDRIAGRNGEAVAGLRRVLALRPEDVDARLNLALALIALNRLDEADRELGIVLEQAPDYADARTARDDIARIRAEGTAVRVDVSVAYGELSQGLGNWRDTNVAISRRTTDGAVSLAIEHADRFGRNDTYVEGRVDRVTRFGSLYGAIGGTVDADFRPEVAARFGGAARIGTSGLVATLDSSVARYVVGTVSSVQPGLDYYSPNGVLTVGARWINVWDEQDDHRTGYSLQAVVAVRPSLRLRAGFADAPESSDGTTVAVRAASLGAEVDVSDRLTLRISGLKEERDAYDRDEVMVGFGYRF